MRRPTVALWCLLSLIPYLPLVMPGEKVLPHSPYSDYETYQLPVREFVRREILEGRFPHWIPHIGAGLPLHAGQQMAVTYPLLTPFVLVFTTNFGIRLSLFLHLILAWWGQYRLCRGRGRSRPASCLAALIVVQSGFAVSHLRAGHVNLILGYALIPWFFHFISRVITAQRSAPLKHPGSRLAFWGSDRGCAGCAEMWRLALVGSGLALVGHPQLGYYAAMAGVFWAGIEIARLECPLEKLRAVRCLAMSGLVAILLSAVQTVPAIELILSGLQSSVRSTDGYAARYSLQGCDVLRMAIPDHTCFGSPWSSHLRRDLFAHETSGFCGVLALMWMLRGIVQHGSARYERAVVRGVGLLVVVSLLMALGTESLVFRVLQECVPGLTLFRCPGRVLGVATILIGVLAARGFDCDPAAGAHQDAGVSVVGGEAPSVLRFRRSDSVPWLVDWLVTISLSLASLELLRVIVCDLALNTASRATVFSLLSFPRMVSGQLALSVCSVLREIAVRRLPDQVPVFQTHVLLFLVWIELTCVTSVGFRMEPARPVSVPRRGLVENTDFRFVECRQDGTIGESNLRYARNVNAALLEAQSTRRSQTSGCLSTVGTNEGGVLPPAVERLFAALRCRPEIAAAVAACRARYDSMRDVWLHQSLSLPRLRIHDASAEKLLSNRLEHLSRTDLRRLVETCHPEQIVRCQETPQELVVACRREAPGYLVIADSWHPGWECTVNGEPTDILAAHGVFRAVALPAGNHRVCFEFHARAFGWAAWCSLLTALVALMGACRIN